MKIILSTIVLTSIAAGLWQNRELSRLHEREEALVSIRKDNRVPGKGAEDQSDTSGPDRTEARKTLDAKAFLRKFEEVLEAKRRPTDEERTAFGDALMSASPRELKALADELRRNSTLPQELKNSLFSAIAPRLAESYPELAAGIAVESRDSDAFEAVMHTWLLSKPDAAASWLKEEMAKVPTSPLASIEGANPEALAMAAELIADDADGGGVTRFMAALGEQREQALEIVVTSTKPDVLAGIMNRISRDSGSPEKERLKLIGSTLGRHPDPEVGRQVLLDAKLPPAQFIQAAAIVVRDADPSTMRSTLDWFLSAAPDSPERAAALEKIRLRWAARAPAEAEAYYREKNLPVAGP